MASEYKLRWFPLTSSLAPMPCVDYIPENTGTQVCSLQLMEHRGLRVKFQIMEWYMSSAMFILHIRLLISCHSRHLKLSNSIHNVGVGVKTLNCLFPVTCCVNSCSCILLSIRWIVKTQFLYWMVFITARSSVMFRLCIPLIIVIL
jgi:hypothetical protein